jgi:Undecaprenyl-phosphate galactose phosphotransferase WbaP
VVVFGAGATGRQLVELLEREPALGLKVAAVLDDDPRTHTPPVLGGLSLAPLLADRFGISCAIVAMPGTRPERLREIVSRYAYRFPRLLVVPNVSGAAMLWVATRDFGSVQGLEIAQNLLRPLPRFSKRVLDLTAAVLAGIVLLPVMAAVAILVRLTSRGPAIYSQWRIGQDRREFRTYKFRTMQTDADALLGQYLERHPAERLEWRMARKLRGDPRLTPVGRILRRTSLDELPQLWNVIRGEMALTGPRPIAADELARYGDGIELYSKVLPGITGLWQVSGRNDTTYAERVRLDEYYVRNWSVWMDLWILGRTARAVITGKGAY